MYNPMKKLKSKLNLRQLGKVLDFSIQLATQHSKKKKDPKEADMVTTTTIVVDKEVVEIEVEVNTNKIIDKITTIGDEIKKHLVRCCAVRR